MAKLTLPSNELTEFDLPRVCVITGATDGVVFKDVKFQWYPRWVAALIIINVLIAAVVAMALTKKVKGKLPFTEEGYAAWRRGVLMNVLGWLGALALLFGGIFSFAGGIPELGGLCLAAMVALPITTYFVFARGRMLRCTEITATQITLELPSSSAVDAMTRHLFAGTPAAAAAASTDGPFLAG
jgi:hypothetical protein